MAQVASPPAMEPTIAVRRRPVVLPPLDPAAERTPAEAAAPERAPGRIAVRLTALLLVLAVFLTLAGSGHQLDDRNPFLLEARADSLHEQWDQMVADGVPQSDVADLQRQWALARQVTLLGAGLTFWWPESSAVLDQWQRETDVIWSRNILVARTGAVQAEIRLHQALASDPAVLRNERLDELATASTPQQLASLRAAWDLQARLVPIDAGVADLVGRLSALDRKGGGLGIITEPAASILARADTFASMTDRGRAARAVTLIRDLVATLTDLAGRVVAALRAQAAFKRAADEMAFAGLWGVALTPYRVQIDAATALFVSAIHMDGFDSIAGKLDRIVADLKRAVRVVQGQVHVISNVAIYFQIHALSCEETAVSMALTHQGIYLSQGQILAEMGADLRPQYRDAHGILRWGNPYSTFVGDVNGIENVTGWGANYPPLVWAALRHRARILAYGYMTAETVYARLAAGHPVVVWVTWDWGWHPRHDYLSFDGRWIPYIGPAQSHVVTAVGVSPSAVLVNDPLRGQYWVGKSSFQAAYSDFMEAIAFA
jgi:uncharacterized protein YvpB